jgi:hypothetical protein
MRIFAENDLPEHLDSLLADLRKTVQSEDKNRLLNVNETEYIEYLVSQYTKEPIKLHLNEVYVSDREAMVPVGNHAFDYCLQPSDRIKCQVIKYHLPYSGEKRMLYLTPNPRLVWSIDVEITENEISFGIVNWNDDVAAIKREADRILENLSTQAQHSGNNVRSYNAKLQQYTQEIVAARKQEHLKQSNLIQSLGVPFKKKQNVPETFAVPIKRQQPLIRKPSSSSEPYNPEPALDAETYRHILRICYDTGVEIERHPSIYVGKDEEALRDHFLMVLAPHFESVTGETFNKKGKTDILIRHEGSNVFVTECKFWHGQKAHYKTIDQLLSYLTWRDSKTSILYFITNKQLTPVLESVKNVTQGHSCFIKHDKDVARGWYSYQFHLPKDETRGVHLAILCFHFPD